MGIFSLSPSLLACNHTVCPFPSKMTLPSLASLHQLTLIGLFVWSLQQRKLYEKTPHKEALFPAWQKYVDVAFEVKNDLTHGRGNPSEINEEHWEGEGVCSCLGLQHVGVSKASEVRAPVFSLTGRVRGWSRRGSGVMLNAP